MPTNILVTFHRFYSQYLSSTSASQGVTDYTDNRSIRSVFISKTPQDVSINQKTSTTQHCCRKLDCIKSAHFADEKERRCLRSACHLSCALFNCTSDGTCVVFLGHMMTAPEKSKNREILFFLFNQPRKLAHATSRTYDCSLNNVFRPEKKSSLVEPSVTKFCPAQSFKLELTSGNF